MEEQQQVTNTPEQASSSAPSTSTESVVKPQSDGAAPTTGGEAAQAWTPDWTYEFDGKKREIDPFFRALAKDEDSLKKVKDYIQRADATQKYREKMQTYESDWKPVVDQVSKLRQYFEKGDHEQVFKALGYDDNTIFQYVRNKLQQAQMPEHERAAIEAKRQAELEKERIMAENMSYREQASQELARVTEIEMDIELAKPQYVALKEAYDKAYGEGSFKNLVIDRGAYMVSMQGEHIRPGQVLANIAKEFTPFMAAHANEAQQPQQQIQKPKVIPNVGKGSGSPSRTAIKSLADLKKRAAQLGD